MTTAPGADSPGARLLLDHLHRLIGRRQIARGPAVIATNLSNNRKLVSSPPPHRSYSFRRIYIHGKPIDIGLADYQTFNGLR
jgi:hypothetical protein